MTHSVRALLKRCNNAQLGSFGEHIFAVVAGSRPGATLMAMRRNRTDFVLNSEPVDVKTTARDLQIRGRILSPYRGPRVEGIRYAQVEFTQDGVRVSLETEILGAFEWALIQEWWNVWKSGTQRVQASANRQTFSPIRNKIVAHFEDIGWAARVLYRTIQSQFGSESPANLIPVNPKPNGVTVFVDFSCPVLTEGNIRRLVAFDDTSYANLPVLEKTRLHRPKIDLGRIPPKYSFATLNELFERFPARNK